MVVSFSPVSFSRHSSLLSLLFFVLASLPVKTTNTSILLLLLLNLLLGILELVMSCFFFGAFDRGTTFFDVSWHLACWSVGWFNGVSKNTRFLCTLLFLSRGAFPSFQEILVDGGGHDLALSKFLLLFILSSA